MAQMLSSDASMSLIRQKSQQQQEAMVAAAPKQRKPKGGLMAFARETERANWNQKKTHARSKLQRPKLEGTMAVQLNKQA